MIFVKISWRTPSLHKMHRFCLLYTNSQHLLNVDQIRPFTATLAAFGQAKYAKHKFDSTATKAKKKWQKVAESSVAGTSLDDGSWYCSKCEFLNFPGRRMCDRCNTAPTEDQLRVIIEVLPPLTDDGSWRCSSCAHLNFPNRLKCKKCENGVPTEEQFQAILRVQWTCAECGLQNHKDGDCWHCKSPKRVAESVAGTSRPDGSWYCSNCANVNFPNLFKCRKCKNGVPTEEQLQAIRRVQWICAQCGLLNYGNGDCRNCKSSKRVAESVAGTSRPDGSWYCSNCANLNFPNRFKCFKCENGVPTEEQLQAIRRVQWICADCGLQNHKDGDCRHCKAPKRVRESITGTTLEDGSWYCSNCIHLNFPNHLKCRKCENGMPTEEQLQAIRRILWICAECGLQNIRDGDYCRHCKSPKRVAKSIAGTSLEDGSWYCSKCEYLQRPEHEICHRCNTTPTDDQLRVILEVLPPSTEAGSWRCLRCAHLNFPTQSFCQKCKIGTPSEEQIQAIRRIEWTCAKCGLQNYEDGDCRHCKSPKQVAESFSGTSIEYGSWYCSNCSCLNRCSNSECKRCSADPTAEQLEAILATLPPSETDGSWYCSKCSKFNFPSLHFCRKCGIGQPTEEQLHAILRVQWTCAECGLQNSYDGDCRICKAPRRVAESVAGTSRPDGSWYCSKCERLNRSEYQICNRCNTTPTEEQLKVILEVLPPLIDDGSGSWYCSSCAHLNFPTQLNCQNCKNGMPTEEQRQAMLELEWTCFKCGLQNHGDVDCYHCKSPKQVAESVGGTSLLDGSWYCPNCFRLNSPIRSKCLRCSAEPTDQQRAAILAALPPSNADGSWYCSNCTHLNFSNCFKCKKCKNGVPTEEQLQAIRRIHWTCAECGLQNNQDGNCWHCKAPKRVGESIAGTALEDGSWFCSNCAHLNFPSQSKCQKCENGMPTKKQLQAILRVQWTCAECGLQNYFNGDCHHCKSPKRVKKSVAGTSLEDGSWYCPKCDFLNFPGRKMCDRCNTTPTEDQLKVILGVLPPLIDDGSGSWYCSSCAHLNFSSQFKCRKCAKGVPTKEQLQAIRRVQWNCAECGILNYFNSDCRHCKSPKRVKKSVASTSLEDGSWYCSSCAHLNFPSQSKCKKCAKGEPTEEQFQTIRRILWTCAECGLQNHKDGECRHCKLPKRVAESVAGTSLEDGSWYCSNCAHLNFPSQSKCKKCENGMPTEEQFQTIQRVQWTCAECGLQNHDDGDCRHCKSPKRVAESVAGTSRPDGSWYCCNCNHLNFPSHLACSKCKAGTPSEEQQQTIRRIEWTCAHCGLLNYREGDCWNCKSPKQKAESVAGTSLPNGSWYCSNCSRLCTTNRSKCSRCSAKPTDEQLAAILATLPSPISDGSWYCSSCGRLNWPARDSCVKCQEPATEAQREKAKLIGMQMAGQTLDNGVWFCSTCGNANLPTLSVCEGCEGGMPTDEQQKGIDRIGIWTCSSCARRNYARNEVCEQCKKGEPNEEQRLRISQSGLWTCTICNTKNGGYRKACFRCKGVKPS